MPDSSNTSLEIDSHSRSLAKALSWRVFALVITTIVSFILSDSVAVAVSIGVVDSLIKIGAYYLHERAWMGIRFGRRREDDPSKAAS
ncbi:MAG: DUF2061 domain-containing protein [Enhygromyxa sp.]